MMQMTQTMKKFKTYQLIDNFFIYSLTVLTCSLFCLSPFWFPSLCSSMKVFLFVSLPNFGLLLFGRKVLFLVANLIVVILLRESKLFASDDSSPTAGDVYYDEYVSRSRRVGNSSTIENKERQKEITCCEETAKKTCGGGENTVKKRWVEEDVETKNGKEDLTAEDEFAFPAEELCKRADDFIARVNRKRRLEAFL